MILAAIMILAMRYNGIIRNISRNLNRLLTIKYYENNTNFY